MYVLLLCTFFLAVNMNNSVTVYSDGIREERHLTTVAKHKLLASFLILHPTDKKKVAQQRRNSYDREN